MPVEFTTTVGRIVWGNPGRPQVKKDNKTKQPILKDGKPIEVWNFGVAFPKADFNQHIYPALYQEALTGFPNGVPNGFSWKITDGDGVDKNGKRYSDREGYAGCFILAVSTEAYAPQIYKYENGAYRQINSNEIETGYYVAVSLNVKLNIPTDRTHTPGLYINPKGIELVGFGQVIVSSGADPTEMFGGVQRALPPGASAVPLASGAPIPGGAVGGFGGGHPAAGGPGGYAAPAPVAYAPPPAAAPQYAPAPVAHMPPPAHDFVRNAGYPTAPAAPQPYAPPAAAPQYAPAPVAYAPPPAAAPQYAPAPQGGYAPQPLPGHAPQGMPGIPTGR